MKDITIELDKKEVKKINEFNQLIKKYFKYFFICNNIIISDNDNRCLDKGIYYIIIQNNPFEKIILDKGNVLQLSSIDIYKSIKDNKKYIKGLILENDILYFDLGEDKERCFIGNIHEKISINIPDISKINFNESDNIELLLEDIESLYGNTMMTINDNNHKVRITKELIPGLKKDSIIKVSFSDDDTDNDIFNMVILLELDDKLFYHYYKCINF